MLVLQYVGNQFIGELCNGSTTDSDSVCEGSNPSSPAKTKRYSFECRFVLTLVKLRKKDLNKALRKPFGEGFLALTEGFCKAYISNTAFLPCKIREQYPSSPAKKSKSSDLDFFICVRKAQHRLPVRATSFRAKREHHCPCVDTNERCCATHK